MNLPHINSKLVLQKKEAKILPTAFNSKQLSREIHKNSK